MHVSSSSYDMHLSSSSTVFEQAVDKLTNALAFNTDNVSLHTHLGGLLLERAEAEVSGKLP
jgi:hypothetical protein